MAMRAHTEQGRPLGRCDVRKRNERQDPARDVRNKSTDRPVFLILDDAVSKLWLTPKSPRYPRPRVPVRLPRPPLHPHRLCSRALAPEPRLLPLWATPPCPNCTLWYCVASSGLGSCGPRYRATHASVQTHSGSREAARSGTPCSLGARPSPAASLPASECCRHACSTNPEETKQEIGVVREAQDTPNPKWNKRCEIHCLGHERRRRPVRRPGCRGIPGVGLFLVLVISPCLASKMPCKKRRCCLRR